MASKKSVLILVVGVLLIITIALVYFYQGEIMYESVNQSAVSKVQINENKPLDGRNCVSGSDFYEIKIETNKDEDFVFDRLPIFAKVPHSNDNKVYLQNGKYVSGKRGIVLVNLKRDVTMLQVDNILDKLKSLNGRVIGTKPRLLVLQVSVKPRCELFVIDGIRQEEGVMNAYLDVEVRAMDI